MSMDAASAMLLEIREKGIRLWSEGGELRYKAPRGALTTDDIDRLRGLKGQIVSLLEQGRKSSAAEPCSAIRERAPAALSQLSRWRLLQAGELHSSRQVASATRMRGELNLNALRKSLAEIISRHAALRTRVVARDGVLTQEIDQPHEPDLVVGDLAAIPESTREAEVQRQIELVVMEPVDVATGPLFAARLLKLGDREHILILAMDHITSDGVSLNILNRDVFAAYRQISRGRAVALPPISMQFPEYAEWQRRSLPPLREGRGNYWNERLAGCGRVRFPEDVRSGGVPQLGWGTVPLHIPQAQKVELLKWCRLRHTTLAMAVFTAHTALVLRWCGASEVTIRYATDGRRSTELENTIGFFASALYIRIELFESDTFVDLLKRITREYCTVYEHADSSHGVEAQIPRPEFTRNAAFNWVPQRSGSDPGRSEDALVCSPIRFAHPVLQDLELDREPAALLFDTDDEVVGGVHFPRSRFSSETMARFGRNWLAFVKALLGSPDQRVKDIVIST